MTRDNRDRVELFSFGEAEVEVRRIALNMDQVQAYNPPPNPAKVTDSRATDYIARFGPTSWELDALEPSVLDRLITNEVRTLIDPEIWAETEAEEAESRETLAKLYSNWDDVSAFVKTL